MMLIVHVVRVMAAAAVVIGALFAMSQLLAMPRAFFVVIAAFGIVVCGRRKLVVVGEQCIHLDKQICQGLVGRHEQINTRRSSDFTVSECTVDRIIVMVVVIVAVFVFSTVERRLALWLLLWNLLLAQRPGAPTGQCE